MSSGDDAGILVDGYRWLSRWASEVPLRLQIRRQPVEQSIQYGLDYQPARDLLTLDQGQLEWMLSEEGRAALAVHGRRPAPSSSGDVLLAVRELPSRPLRASAPPLRPGSAVDGAKTSEDTVGAPTWTDQQADNPAPAEPQVVVAPSGGSAAVDDDESATIYVRNFLELPVGLDAVDISLEAGVGHLRSIVATAARTPPEDVVLGFATRILAHDEATLEAAGLDDGCTVTATRRVRGGADEDDAMGDHVEPGSSWECRVCRAPNRAGLECYQCGTPNPLLNDGQIGADGSGTDSETPSSADMEEAPAAAVGGINGRLPIVHVAVGGPGTVASPVTGVDAESAGEEEPQLPPPPGLAAVYTHDGQLWVQQPGDEPGAAAVAEVPGDGDEGPVSLMNGHSRPQTRITVDELLAASDAPGDVSGTATYGEDIPAPVAVDPTVEADLLMRLLMETLMQVTPYVRSGWIIRALPELLQLISEHPAAPTSSGAAAWAAFSGSSVPPPGSPAAVPGSTPSPPGAGVSPNAPTSAGLAYTRFADSIVSAFIGAPRDVPVGAILEAVAQPAAVHPLAAGEGKGSGKTGGPTASASSASGSAATSGAHALRQPGVGTRPGQQQQQHAAPSPGGGSGPAGAGPASPPPAAQGS